MAEIVSDPQGGFLEEPLEDKAIKDAIDDYMTKVAQAADAKQAVGDAYDKMHALIKERNLDPGDYRSGDSWIVKISDVPAHQRLKVKVAKPAKKA